MMMISSYFSPLNTSGVVHLIMILTARKWNGWSIRIKGGGAEFLLLLGFPNFFFYTLIRQDSVEIEAGWLKIEENDMSSKLFHTWNILVIWYVP